MIEDLAGGPVSGVRERARAFGFLDARGPTGWSLPFVSTVTGKVETEVDAEYWCVTSCVLWLAFACVDGSSLRTDD